MDLMKNNFCSGGNEGYTFSSIHNASFSSARYKYQTLYCVEAISKKIMGQLYLIQRERVNTE